ncbi:MAG TPA: SRPBCC family protein [Mycobacteriales bacterium]|nr:SRPBCC family protein [Mycobacteriales bacterium]
MVDRIEVSRQINASPEKIFALLASPAGHVAIDATGMLQSYTGEPVSAVGDSFVIHMDRESLNDFPELGRYDVTVLITTYEQDREIAWTPTGRLNLNHVYGYRLEPGDGGTLVTQYYDWSAIEQNWRDMNIFPVISETALRATLGILARTVEAH